MIRLSASSGSAGQKIAYWHYFLNSISTIVYYVISTFHHIPESLCFYELNGILHLSDYIFAAMV